MSIQAGNTYRLVNVKSGTALDLSGTDNKSISGYTAHDGDNQKWKLENSDGHWTFQCVRGGQYLGFEGNPEDGTPLVAVGNPVQWDIWPDEQDSSVYRVFVPGANPAINIDLSDHGNATPGTIVTLWGKWEGTNQTWRFEQE